MRNTPDVTSNGRASLGLWDEFDRVFENFFTPASTNFSSARLMRPAYDIEESDTHYVLSFDLPGMKQEDINIEVKDKVLSVSGERKREETGVRRSERFYGKFERQFALPDNVNSDGVEANYEHGVLKIALPKMEEAKPKKIQVGVNSNKEGSFFNRLIGREAKDVQ